MQWSQIKTLFILCFLILDVYLLLQFIDKQDRADQEQYSRNNDLTIQEKLESEEITLGDIDVGIEKEASIIVSPIEFTEGQVGTVEGLDNQETVINSNNLIIGHMDEPIPIAEEASGEEIGNTIGNYIYRFGDYQFWHWDKDLNALLFFQEKENQPIYYNQYGLLLVFLNEDNEVEYYTQSILGDAKQHEERTLIPPLRAIETLYDNNELYSQDHVDNVQFGYHTWIPTLSSGKQVFAPTYKITVNGEAGDRETRDYFVNAIEGQVFSNTDEDFTRDVIVKNLSEVQMLTQDPDWKDDMVNKLRSLTQTDTNRSELP
ncbi:two-component system regulatory protein YycI [Oceanobacillus kapialis]|uniref:Two-component system regulatory protein YycI n=1 Tax=Oceanobacillus kapialis TaxID=481353 RepID=A0ABW5PW48_9BACI